MIGDTAIVRVQSPVRLGAHSEPGPDVALLAPRADYYADAHPEPESILLIVEVADTSREVDRQVKLPVYAEAGIPEVWLVDLIEERIEVYSAPSDPAGYATDHSFEHSQQLTSPTVANLRLSVEDVFG